MRVYKQAFLQVNPIESIFVMKMKHITIFYGAKFIENIHIGYINN